MTNRKIKKPNAKIVENIATGQPTTAVTPDFLMDILRLAGMKPVVPTDMPMDRPPSIMAQPQTFVTPMTHDDAMPDMSDTSDDFPMEIPMDEEDELPEYDNTPDEDYAELDALLNAGDDMHRNKSTFPKVAGGDNPMQTQLAERLWSKYKALTKSVS